jgi:hypothetical protein
LGPGLAVGLL